MPDSYIIVTLSAADAGSGPNYNAFYSTDCVNYSASVPATVSLPSVGSQATITVPDNTQCVKLTNINSNCINSVSASIAITTTTTSTSTTTTSTTTTTGAPTTTTTTLAPNCVCYEVLVTSPGGETFAAAIDYLDCGGSGNVGRVFANPGTYYQCAQNVGGLPQINFTFGSGSITPIGSCNSGTCPPATTTTTPPQSDWTASNSDCGFGTLNDIGINGSFMGTLSGPSTFPLTSTLYGYKTNPNGINYGGTNTIQANVTTNLPGTGNCAVLRVVVNGVEPTPYETYFTSNPFPQVSGVTINSGDDVWVYVQCYSGSCPATTTTTGAPTTTTTTTTTAAPTTTTTTEPCPYTIYTHGAAIGNCSNYCTTNYLIQTVTCAGGNYNTLTIGDYIYGITGPGFVAYSNVSTDTNTGPFKIAEIDENGQVISILICDGAVCAIL